MNKRTTKLLRKVAATEAHRNPRWRTSYRRLKARWNDLPKSVRFNARKRCEAIVANAGGVA